MGVNVALGFTGAALINDSEKKTPVLNFRNPEEEKRSGVAMMQTALLLTGVPLGLGISTVAFGNDEPLFR
jgi:hypothetical protein